MKTHIQNFIFHGLVALGFGPVVMATIYLILYKSQVILTLSVPEVCLGIFSSALLAFIVGGTNSIYKIERLPLSAAIFIHGCTLYITYLTIYLLNGWLKKSLTPILVFTGIFIVCYLIIWAILYNVNKKKTDRLNEVLREKQSLDS